MPLSKYTYRNDKRSRKRVAGEMSKPRPRTSGFTLIEVLVAIAIFASLSIGAYQVVNQVQRSNELSNEKSQRLAEIQRALAMMDADFRQLAVRTHRSNGEEPSKLLIRWDDYLIDSDAKGLLFSRSGWLNPAQQFPRGEVSKIGYRIKDETLERVWWRYADTPTGQEGSARTLLSGVEQFSVEFFTQSGWKAEWQEPLKTPKGIKVILELNDYSTLERIYLVSEGQLDDETQDSSGNEDSNE